MTGGTANGKALAAFPLVGAVSAPRDGRRAPAAAFGGRTFAADKQAAVCIRGAGTKSPRPRRIPYSSRKRLCRAGQRPSAVSPAAIYGGRVAAAGAELHFRTVQGFVV